MRSAEPRYIQPSDSLHCQPVVLLVPTQSTEPQLFNAMETSPTEYTQNDHAPCVICRELYSPGPRSCVEACSGCKAFFRRTVRQDLHLHYKCKAGRQCLVEGLQRKMCRFCRFQRCLDAGMISRKELKSVNAASPYCLDYSSCGFDRMPKLDELDRDDLSLASLPSKFAAPEKLANVDLKLSDCDEIVLQYALQQLKGLSPAAMRKLSNVSSVSDVMSVHGGYARADEAIFEQQLLTYLTTVGQSLKSCAWFSVLSSTNQNILIDNYEPQAMLFGLIGATLSANNRGDMLVLPDGLHAIARSDVVANTGLREMTDCLLDELIRRFRELNVDDNERAVLQLLALWNSNLPCLDPVGKASVDNIRLLLHSCLRHCAEGHEEAFTSAQATDGRYWALLDLFQSMLKSVQAMKNCLPRLRLSEAQDHEDFEFDVASFLL